MVKRVIPCLDVAGGRVVKGVNFENLREMGEPVELARRYSELGADELVFLDITATLEGRGPILDVIGRAADELTIPFTAGGGISGVDDARGLLLAGAMGLINWPRSTTEIPALAADSAPRRSSARSTLAGARSSRTPAASRAVETRSPGRARPSTGERGRSSSRRSTPTGRAGATTSS
jgi:cyclase